MGHFKKEGSEFLTNRHKTPVPRYGPQHLTKMVCRMTEFANKVENKYCHRQLQLDLFWKIFLEQNWKISLGALAIYVGEGQKK